MKKAILSIAISALILLAGSTMNAQSSEIQLVRDDEKHKVDVIVDGKLFTSYQYPDNIEKPFLYPVYAPNGSVITRGFPIEPRKGERIDHPHHIGIWFNYADLSTCCLSEAANTIFITTCNLKLQVRVSKVELST